MYTNLKKMTRFLSYNFTNGSYNSPIELNSQEMRLLETTYQETDEGNKGFLNESDVKVAVMQIFGHKPSMCEVRQLLASFGSEQGSGEQGLSLAQFINAMKPKFAAVDEDEEIRNTFMAFDKNCRGFLTLDDVKKAFVQVCPQLAEQRVELAFRELDRDRDGRISYKDFDFMMKFDNSS